MKKLNDLSKTIEGFYTLLKGTKGIKKRQLSISKDIYEVFGYGSTDDLEAYISNHIIDAAPKQKLSGKFGIQVQLDRSKFYGGFWEVFSMNNDTGAVIGSGSYVSLIDKSGELHGVSDENLANQDMEAVSVSAETNEFIENYEARMKDFQNLVGVLTGKIDGRLGYHGREAKSK